MNYQVEYLHNNLNRFQNGEINLKTENLIKIIGEDHFRIISEENGSDNAKLLIELEEQGLISDVFAKTNSIFGEELPLIKILNKDQEMVITDLDFLEFLKNISPSEVSYSFKSDEFYFFYDLFQWAQGQGGATLIFNIETGKWVYSAKGDDAVVDGIVYLPKKKVHLGLSDLHTYAYGYLGAIVLDYSNNSVKDYALETWKANFRNQTKGVKGGNRIDDAKLYGPGTTGWIPLPFFEGNMFSFDEEKNLLCYQEKIYQLPDI